VEKPEGKSHYEDLGVDEFKLKWTFKMWEDGRD